MDQCIPPPRPRPPHSPTRERGAGPDLVLVVLGRCRLAPDPRGPLHLQPLPLLRAIPPHFYPVLASLRLPFFPALDLQRICLMMQVSVRCAPRVPAIPPRFPRVIAEALTRLIQDDPHIKGIEINGEHIKISQFADDTSLFSESYEEFLIAALGGGTGEALGVGWGGVGCLNIKGGDE